VSQESVKLGATLQKRFWRNSPWGSAQEKAKVSWLTAQPADSLSRLFLVINTQKLKSELTGPPFRTEYTNYKYETEALQITEHEGTPKLERVATLTEPLPYTPSALFALSATQGFVGSNSTVESLLLEGGEMIREQVYNFKPVAKKVVDAFAFNEKTKTLVAVDDTIWPKWAFVFDASTPAKPKHKFNHMLPEMVNEQFQEAALGGKDGNLLALTAFFSHRGGKGQHLYVLRVEQEQLQDLATFGEFSGRETNEIELIISAPKTEQRFKAWKGLGFLGEHILLGASERGIIAINSRDISDSTKPELVDVGGSCLHLKVCKDKAFALVQTPKVFRIAVVDASLKVLYSHDLGNLCPKCFA